ncbi:MAG: NIPSNAP family protein [Gemmataceae bacterium]
MRRLLAAVTLSAVLAPVAGLSAAEKDTRFFELRIYTAAPGKLDALNARFRDHTVALFAKHGITNVGYFVPVDNAANQLVYLLAYPSKEAHDASWKAFQADPDWQAARKESEKDGKLVTKVEQRFLTPTDYSPALKIESKGDRVFELRTYTATKGNLAALNGRFREHTMKLFEKHGITNISYWNLAPGQKGEDVTLVYMLAHPSVEAAKASFDEFRKDPDWVAAKEASEKAAGGSLTEPKGGVVSQFLKPVDYSALK